MVPAEIRKLNEICMRKGIECCHLYLALVFWGWHCRMGIPDVRGRWVKL